MITPSAEPFINKSVINRHSCVSRRRNMIPKHVPSKPVETIIVKKIPKKINAKPVIKEEPVQQEIIEEIKPEQIDNKPESEPIEEPIEQEPVKVDSMEEAIQTAVNDTPIERKIEIEQHNTYNVLSNRTANMSHRYTYNSILGTRVYYK